MSIGFLSPAAAGRKERSLSRVSGDELRQRQPARVAGVGQQDPRPAGVGHHGDPTATGYRLRGQQGDHVEQLLQRLGADHACLLEEGIHGDVEAGQRGRVAGSGAAPCRGTSGLHGHDRLPARHLRSQSREPARVAEALEVEGDDRRARVVLPVGQKVVARHVGLVAHRNERGKPDVQLVGVVQDGQAERAALERACPRCRAGPASARRWR